MAKCPPRCCFSPKPTWQFPTPTIHSGDFRATNTSNLWCKSLIRAFLAPVQAHNLEYGLATFLEAANTENTDNWNANVWKANLSKAAVNPPLPIALDAPGFLRPGVQALSPEYLDFAKDLLSSSRIPIEESPLSGIPLGELFPRASKASPTVSAHLSAGSLQVTPRCFSYGYLLESFSFEVRSVLGRVLRKVFKHESRNYSLLIGRGKDKQYQRVDGMDRSKS